MSNDRLINSKDGASLDDNTEIGQGGELHQLADGEHASITTNQGLPISDITGGFYPPRKNHAF